MADRDADVWEPLIAIADAAGGLWPEVARVAAVTLVTESKDSAPSLGVRLLTDLRLVFKDHEHLSTRAILEALIAIEESPWSDIKDKPVDSRRLASYLKPYGVSSTTFRDGTTTAKGYRREDLHDPWLRYLPKSDNSVTKVTGNPPSILFGGNP